MRCRCHIQHQGQKADGALTRGANTSSWLQWRLLGIVWECWFDFSCHVLSLLLQKDTDNMTVTGSWSMGLEPHYTLICDTDTYFQMANAPQWITRNLIRFSCRCNPCTVPFSQRNICFLLTSIWLVVDIVNHLLGLLTLSWFSMYRRSQKSTNQITVFFKKKTSLLEDSWILTALIKFSN